jgi:hypothetical protein
MTSRQMFFRIAVGFAIVVAIFYSALFLFIFLGEEQSS